MFGEFEEVLEGERGREVYNISRNEMPQTGSTAFVNGEGITAECERWWEDGRMRTEVVAVEGKSEGDEAWRVSGVGGGGGEQASKGPNDRVGRNRPLSLCHASPSGRNWQARAVGGMVVPCSNRQEQRHTTADLHHKAFSV